MLSITIPKATQAQIAHFYKCQQFKKTTAKSTKYTIAQHKRLCDWSFAVFQVVADKKILLK